MSADVTTGTPVAKEAPTEQQQSQPGVPKKITNAQTVCNEKNAKGKLCNGHIKQMKTGGEEAEKHLRGDDVLFKCQTCGTLYMGPPLGHVRDPEKQSRFVEKELTAILRAAGGTLPAFKKSERGTLVPLEEDTSHHAPAPAATAAKPAAATAAKPATPAAKPTPAASPSAAPANETPEERKARLIAEAQARKAAGGAAAAKPAAPAAAKAPAAPSTSGTDSSAEADRHRPAAEAQAATGQASAAPMSSAASTASPAAGAETVSDLAPEASTELTPGAPKDEREQEAGENKT